MTFINLKEKNEKEWIELLLRNKQSFNTLNSKDKHFDYGFCFKSVYCPLCNPKEVPYKKKKLCVLCGGKGLVLESLGYPAPDSP